MKNPKFTLFQDAASEYRFNLFAVNGRNILHSSEGYTSKGGCLNGIDAVKRNAPFDHRYSRKSTTVRSTTQYFFTLHAANGRTLGISEMYTTVAARENGIDAVKRDAPISPIEDLS
jgi:uncharacterized protein YegP (UPF0339 family)